MSLFALESKGREWTIGLVLVNVFVFLAVNVFLGGAPLVYLGQVNWLVLARGEVWRLLTAIFVHGDVWHLLSNAFGLFLFGVQVEDEVGGPRMVGTFLAAALFANLMGLVFTPTYVLSLGASGGVFGLLGVYFMLFRRYEPSAILVGLAFVLLFVLLSVGPGIDAWAHFFGAVVGMIAGIAFSRGTNDRFEDVY